VTDFKAVIDFVTAVETRFGRIDFCVTNFGGPPSNWFKNIPPEAWAALDQLLMVSAIYFAREASSAAIAKEQVGTSDYDLPCQRSAARGCWFAEESPLILHGRVDPPSRTHPSS
jgi:NAD(P)-dependent dehydrogenase (short-subunit alcohol dehydrogenase family)